jgi:omega-amidase
MTKMNVTVVQTDIVWEDKKANIAKLEKCLNELKGTTDIAILPEMFATGFSMNCEAVAEPIDGEVMHALQRLAQSTGIALVGSFNCEEQGQYFNRAFFVTPSHLCYFYDKRHLFRMGEEADHFSAGSKQLIIPYKGFNIALLVCYDLRFPVWSRNRDNGYDVLVYVANWPASRRKVWDTLLRARALENMSYVIGVNRVGTDGYKLPYDGGSIVISAKGETLASVADNTEGTATVSIDTESLVHFRNKFPVWKDADAFKL